MSAEDSSNPGGLGRATVKSSSSPQDEYYRYELMKSKLGGKHADILNAQSEQDEVEIMILKKLVKVRESTAEWNQVVDLTGSKNRFEQARILAEIAYEKKKAEKVLGFYVPNAGELEAVFDKTDGDARAVRTSGGNPLGGVGDKSSATRLAQAGGIQ